MMDSQPPALGINSSAQCADNVSVVDCISWQLASTSVQFSLMCKIWLIEHNRT